MDKTIGILAHVDAGKTTFAEQILYHTKSIRNRGRIDHKNSFLDSHNIERENGSKFKAVDKVSAGEIFAVTGLSGLAIGDGIGAVKEKNNYEMVPTLKSKVIFDEAVNVKEVLSYFKILEAEDPTLNIIWDERLKEIQVHIMGTIQLEILKQLLEERFSLSVDFGIVL